MSLLTPITGAGGGGGSHTPVEAPNTLISKTTARVLFLASAGEIGGVATPAAPLKSVYFNNVPVQNADDTFNFSRTSVVERVGLPSQTAIEGFTNVSASFNVATKVTTASPVTYTSSTSDVDAIRVGIRFPALFEQAANGDTNGTTVTFEVYRRLGAGSFELVQSFTKTDKANSPADADYLIQRPAGAGTWSVRVNRITADNAANNRANDIFFQTATEIKYVTETYNNYAVYGVTATSETAGARYPNVSIDLEGILLQVPSNYDPVTRTYDGVWDGLFSGTPQVSDNPAWVLYYLLTNPENGLGIPAANINQYDFYDAAVYNDATVPALVNGAVSGTEPRYTFNYQYFDSRDDAYTVCQNLAATFGAGLYGSGDFVRLIQDRPTTSSRIITNSNVIDGAFERSYSNKDTRTTACVVYWNNPDENWIATPVYYEDAAAVSRYGLNSKEVTGIGVTSEGQALRLAKWHVETGISNTEVVDFRVGFKNAGIEPGEVVTIMDTDYAGVSNEARVVSVTASTIVVDRPINIASGNTFTVVAADGSTVYTRTVSSTTTGTTINYSGATLVGLVAGGCEVIFITAISPKQYKVTNVREERTDDDIHWWVSAVEYDSAKFGRVDNTPTGNAPVYQLPVLIPGVPVNLSFKESAVNDNNTVSRKLLISWTRPTVGVTSGYLLRIRHDNSNWEAFNLTTVSFEVSPANHGQYDVEVFAIDYRGVMGARATGTYTIAIAGGSASALDAPTDLVSDETGSGTAFTKQDLYFRWTNPASNGTKVESLRDFEVTFVDPATSTVLSVTYVPPVLSGSNQSAAYFYSQNVNDGGPRRSVRVEVRCRDKNNNLSAPVTATFTNAAPAAPTVSTQAGVDLLFIDTVKDAADTDVQGYEIHASTTTGFTPTGNVSGSGTCVYSGPNSFVSIPAVGGTTYFVRAAAYDVFGNTGLTYSTQTSATPSAPAVFSDYEFVNFTFTPNTPGSNQVTWSAGSVQQTAGPGSPATSSVTTGNATWSSGSLYIFWSKASPTILQSTTSITTATGADKRIVAVYRGGTDLSGADGKVIIDGTTNIFPGTISAPSLVTGTAVITTEAQMAAATINAAAIKDAVITNAKLVNATIETLKLKNGAVTDIKYVQTSTDQQSPLFEWGGASGTRRTFNSSWYSPVWDIAAPTGVSGPFPVNLIITVGSPRTIFPGHSIQVIARAFVERWNGSSWVQHQTLSSTNTILQIPSGSGTIGGGITAEIFQALLSNANPTNLFRIRIDHTYNQFVFSGATSGSNSVGNGYVQVTAITQLK